MNTLTFRVNPILIGIIIAYLVLGIDQIFSKTMLPNTVYMTIACVSLELSILEIIKLLLKQFQHFSKEEKNELSSSDIIPEKAYKSLRRNKAIISMMRFIIYFGYVMIAFFIFSFPFKIVPYDFASNKAIAVSTIFTFVFTFSYHALNQFFSSYRMD